MKNLVIIMVTMILVVGCSKKGIIAPGDNLSLQGEGATKDIDREFNSQIQGGNSAGNESGEDFGGGDFQAESGPKGTLPDVGSFYELCVVGNAQQIQSALDNGASANAIDKNGFSPLFYAVLGHPQDYSNALAKMKVALKTDNDDEFYLQRSLCPVTHGNYEAVMVLLKNNANVRLPDRSNNTSFLYACLFSSDIRILKAMVDAGADTAERITVTYPTTLLSFTVFLNTNAQCVKYIADVSRDIAWKNKFGTTAIMWAAMYQSNPQVIDALIDAGADINDSSHKDGYTPLYWAERCNRNPEVVDHIRQLGGKTNNPQYTVAKNEKFPKLGSGQVFVGAATTPIEFEYMVQKACEFRKGDILNAQKIKGGLMEQGQFDATFSEREYSDGHWAFSYSSIKRFFDWYRLSVNEEGALYYVIGVNTKPFFYNDSKGTLHYKNGVDDYTLTPNQDYYDSWYSYYGKGKRYYYKNKKSGETVYVDPSQTTYKSRGYVFVYEIATGKIFSDYATLLYE